MLRLLTYEQLCKNSRLKRSMLMDRGAQFKKRLGWNVSTDWLGRETDQYDTSDAIYVVWINQNGLHGGSMRLHRTDLTSMAHDHFIEALPAGLRSADTWETTRFCISPERTNNNVRVSAAIMFGACEFGLINNLRNGLGVFDKRSMVLYRAIGWPANVIGETEVDGEKCYAGLWSFKLEHQQKLFSRAGIIAGKIDYPSFDLQFQNALTHNPTPRVRAK